MKNKLFPISLLLLLLISNSAFSQRTGEEIRVHIAPLNLFDPKTGVLQLGVQKNLNTRLALSFDHGFKLQTFRNFLYGSESDRKNYKFSKTKAELKYFIPESASNVSSYISMEGMYFPQKYEKEKAYLIRNNISYKYEYSNITRTVWVSSLKYGIEVNYNKFVYETFFGLGVRRLSIAHEPFGLVEQEYHMEADISFQPIDRNEGIFYRPHVSLGVKIGYIIW